MVRIVGLAFAILLAGDVKEGMAEPADGSFQVQRVSGICPQNRTTRKAPGRYLKKKNPVPPTAENIAEGRRLFNQDAKPTACKLCHGARGNGNGSLARRLEPPPRNFTCADAMEGLPDGQLFWIIQNGSRGTAMPAHKSTLKPEEIWQLILFIRKFLKA
ncbi:MAG: c-type cytochrome [Nitrospina sp.]|jgi:mono/diheme cytochrome c family protein|nr:c-type cytochrome [Nitrospina sp.]MBT3414088.1 c-type cytochrome [Nitrospina sp.]MBT3855970.1 c-type cytochrome [Nitrospina sp.]MBT4103399.1 c-type cytochrome [Nitrospina sp.]MBT4388846.1 c-type cytochrome [Nitrospina sp.]